MMTKNQFNEREQFEMQAIDPFVPQIISFASLSQLLIFHVSFHW